MPAGVGRVTTAEYAGESAPPVLSRVTVLVAAGPLASPPFGEAERTKVRFGSTTVTGGALTVAPPFGPYVSTRTVPRVVAAPTRVRTPKPIWQPAAVAHVTL